MPSFTLAPSIYDTHDVRMFLQMYSMNKSSWSVGGTTKLRRKTEGKGNMKIVYVRFLGSG